MGVNFVNFGACSKARTGWRSCRFLPRNRAISRDFVKLAFSQPQIALKSSRRTPLETGLDLDERYQPRSEERRVGTECGSSGIPRRFQYTKKKKKKKQT